MARELWLGEVLLKRFRRRAPVAEMILAAFEEEGWPPRIFDPLPPRDGSNESLRLRCELQRLNRGLEKKLIRFLMDGMGEGVRWELV